MKEFYDNILLKEPDEVEENRLHEYEFNGVLFGLYDPSADDSVNKNDIVRGNNVIPAFKLGADYAYYKERIQEVTELDYEAEESGHKWFVFTDPDGNIVEMYE